MYYLPFLRALHDRLQPARYLEIGVHNGSSMAQSRCRSVGIDPAFGISREIDCDVALFRTTSDEYFARPDPLAPTGGEPFDLVFIDGLHLFEFALRDFINSERYCSARSLIVFDDVLPRNVDEAARIRHTASWTGDVYPMLDVLARYRPELTVIPVGTTPTGLLLVLGLDPHNTELADNYEAILTEYRHPDPQPVPESVFDRLISASPERVLASGFWRVLATAEKMTTPDEVRSMLADELVSSLGVAFASGAQAVSS
jgi:Methyltransferase domain